MIGDGTVLYLNPICAQGFEYCHIVQSTDNFYLMPIQKQHTLIFNKVSPQGQYMLNQQNKLYCWALKKKYQDEKQSIQQDEYNELIELIRNFDDFGQNLRYLFTTSDNNQQNTNNQNIDHKVCQIIQRDLINKPIFKYKEIKDPSITFCLLYNGESQEELRNKLYSYQQFCNKILVNKCVVFVILVNGKQSLHNSLQNFNDNYNIQKIPDQIRHNTCQAYEYTDNQIELNNCILLLITEKQSQIKLLRWIYSGVFKHFYSKYCYVGDLDCEIKQECFEQAFYNIFDSEQHNLSQSNSNNYFGASGYCNLIRKKDQNNNTTNSLFEEIITDLYIRYNNYLNFQFQVDSLAQIKKYHNPFFGCYKLNSIYNIIDEYLQKLEKDYEKGKIDLKLNLILPKMMFKKSKEILYVPASAMRDKIIKKEDEAFYKQFNDLQLKQKSLIECNKKAAQIDSLFYKLIYKQREIEFKLKLAIVLFIFIFSPYQLFWQITGNYILRICATIFLPFFILLFLFLYIILPQQYQITDVITKNSKRFIWFFQKESQLLVYFNSKSCYGQLIEDIENKSNEVKFDYKDKSYSIFKMTLQDQQNKNQQISFSKNQVYESQCNIIKEYQVAIYYKILFLITCIITFLSSFVVIFNIFYTYPYFLVIFDQSYVKFQIMLLLLVILGLLLLRTRDIKLLIGMVFFTLTIVMYSEIYHMLHYSKKFKQYYYAFNRLGEYLTITIFFLFIFLLIENLSGFQGYVFLGIIYYNLFIILFDTLSVILAYLMQKKQQYQQLDSIDGNSYQNQEPLNMTESKLCIMFEEQIKILTNIFQREQSQQNQNQ